MSANSTGLNIGLGAAPNVPMLASGGGDGGGWHYTVYLGILAVLCLIGAIIYVFVYKPTLMPRMSWMNFGIGGTEGFTNGGAMTSKKLSDILSVAARKGAPLKEGFGSVARGSGAPDCNRVLPDAAKVADALNDNSDDARELNQLVGKLACFKKDLIGVARVVEATRYQTFNTSHDLQPITETISMCFAKNIPSRDLGIIMDKYRGRGLALIGRLGGSQGVPVATIRAYEGAFNTSMTDVRSLAEQGCLGQHDNAMNGGPAVALMGVGRVEGVTTDDVSTLKPYDGYF
jgi:hypothetical protein